MRMVRWGEQSDGLDVFSDCSSGAGPAVTPRSDVPEVVLGTGACSSGDDTRLAVGSSYRPNERKGGKIAEEECAAGCWAYRAGAEGSRL